MTSDDGFLDSVLDGVLETIVAHDALKRIVGFGTLQQQTSYAFLRSLIDTVLAALTLWFWLSLFSRTPAPSQMPFMLCSVFGLVLGVVTFLTPEIWARRLLADEWRGADDDRYLAKLKRACWRTHRTGIALMGVLYGLLGAHAAALWGWERSRWWILGIGCVGALLLAEGLRAMTSARAYLINVQAEANLKAEKTDDAFSAGATSDNPPRLPKISRFFSALWDKLNYMRDLRGGFFSPGFIDTCVALIILGLWVNYGVNYSREGNGWPYLVWGFIGAFGYWAPAGLLDFSSRRKLLNSAPSEEVRELIEQQPMPTHLTGSVISAIVAGLIGAYAVESLGWDGALGRTIIVVGVLEFAYIAIDYLLIQAARTREVARYREEWRKAQNIENVKTNAPRPPAGVNPPSSNKPAQAKQRGLK